MLTSTCKLGNVTLIFEKLFSVRVNFLEKKSFVTIRYTNTSIKHYVFMDIKMRKLVTTTQNTFDNAFTFDSFIKNMRTLQYYRIVIGPEL